MNNSNTITMLRYSQCKAQEVPYVGHVESTINNYLGAVDPVTEPGDNYTMKYFVMGNNGYPNDEPGALPISSVPSRNPRLGVLFNHLPFRVMEAANDLIQEERETYGCRVLFSKNGVDYVAYFAKKISAVDDLLVTAAAVGQQAGPSDVQPLMLPTRYDKNIQQDIVTVSSKMHLQITELDIANARKYSTITYGTTLHALIREIGLCIGVDKDNNGNSFCGLELVSSINVGGVGGITEPREIALTMGRSTMMVTV